LGQAGAADTQATIALGRPAAAGATVVQRPATGVPAAAPGKGRIGLWLGMAAAVLLVAAGGYYLAGKSSTPVVTADPDHKAAEQKAEQEAALRRQIEEDTRKKVEAELAEKKRLEDQDRQKAEAEAVARRKTEEDERKAAEAAETALRLSPTDRQRAQVAVTALGFNTGASDGAFNPRTREMIADWQRGKNYPPTGFLTGTQNQALLREAAPALAKYDEDQKRTEEARKKAEEEKAKAAQPPPGSPQQAAVAPPATSGPATGVDGLWRGTYHCTPARGSGDFTIHLQMQVAGGSGTWTRPGSGPGTTGNQSLTIKINGSQVMVSRYHAVANQTGVYSTGTMMARYENGTITGTAPEQNSGGRTCTIILTR
jgi:hypothetical protein